MKLSDHVISLELSKKLKQLGVKQESLFSYGKEYKYEDNFELDFDKYTKKNIENYSAFIASELLELLPYKIHEDNYITISKHAEYVIYYGDYINSEIYFEDFNLSNVFAKMLIFLIENKLIKD